MVSNMNMQVLHVVEMVRTNSVTTELIIKHTFTANASIQTRWLTRAGAGRVARPCLIAITPPSMWWETGGRKTTAHAAHGPAGRVPGSHPALGGFHLDGYSVIDFNWMKFQYSSRVLLSILLWCQGNI